MPYDFIDRIALARRSDAAFNVLEADMRAEQASALGHHGRQAEAALAALRGFAGDDAEARLALLKKAAREVWAYFVQREACGLRDHKPIIKDYAIPGEVLARLGAIEKPQK